MTPHAAGDAPLNMAGREEHEACSELMRSLLCRKPRPGFQNFRQCYSQATVAEPRTEVVKVRVLENWIGDAFHVEEEIEFVSRYRENPFEIRSERKESLRCGAYCWRFHSR